MTEKITGSELLDNLEFELFKQTWKEAVNNLSQAQKEKRKKECNGCMADREWPSINPDERVCIHCVRFAGNTLSQSHKEETLT